MNDTFLIDRVERFHALELEYGCKMRIYGSVATGAAGQDSDVDVLVNFNERVRWAPLWRDLGLLFEREVDLVIETELMTLLRDRIMNEARTIDQLIAGDRPPILAKSPYLYLASIEKSAQNTVGAWATRHAAGRNRIQCDGHRTNGGATA